MKDLVSGDFDYSSYDKESARYAFNILNSIVKNNIGLFCLDDSNSFTALIIIVSRKI